MDDVAVLSRTIVITIVAGVLAQVVSGVFRLPSIIFLLLFGVALGPHGAGVIDPRKLGSGLEVIVTLSVSIILFEGSMTLKLRHIREVQRTVRRLITWGVLITLIGATAAAVLLMDAPLRIALLFGALVTVTGPTVIRPLLRRLHVRKEASTVLEGEGILIDPIGAILAVVVLEFALGRHHGFRSALLDYGVRLAVGAGVGAVVGGLVGLIVRYMHGPWAGLKGMLVLAFALASYGIAEGLQKESGLMAVVAGGLLAQIGVRPHEREVREFKEQLTTLLISILFILLSANLDLRRMLELGAPGLLVVLVVMFVVRPVNVFLCSWGGKLSFREKLFLSWIAPRGIVAASVASLAALKLYDIDDDRGGSLVESLVFLTVFLTVIAQGATAGLLARILGIVAREEGTVIVVGANPIARALGRLFQAAGRTVMLIDTNPYHCLQAERESLQATCGSANDREVLRQAGILDAGTFVSCTESARANEMAALLAREEFDLKNVYVAVDVAERKELDPMLQRQHVRLAFGRPIRMDSWSGDLQDGSARIEKVPVGKENVGGKAIAEIPFADNVVPLAVTRSGHVTICVRDTRLQSGDTLHLLVRDMPYEELTTSLELVEKPPAPPPPQERAPGIDIPPEPA